MLISGFIALLPLLLLATSLLSAFAHQLSPRQGYDLIAVALLCLAFLNALVSLQTLLRSYGFIGPIETLLSFTLFFLVLHAENWSWGIALSMENSLHQQASAAFLATIIFSQIGNVVVCSSNRQSALPYLSRLYGWIITGLVVELFFILSIIYMPSLQTVFSKASPVG